MLLKAQKIGRTHKAKNLPCQDRCMTYSDGEALVLVVADGHGGEPYVRSGFGARIACRMAVKVLSDANVPPEEYPACIKAGFDSCVEKHLRLRPLTEREKEKLGNNPENYAYGTTLMAAKLTQDGTYILHIGDGKIHAVRRNGEFFPELPEDPDCRGNSTSSLVTEDAQEKIRTAYYGEPAGCVILHTDGYQPDGEYPWMIYGNAGYGYSHADLLAELEAGDRRGDDQTAVLFYDSENVELEVFHNGLEKEAEKYRRKCRRARLLKREKELSAFLASALEKYKRLGRAEMEEFKTRSIQPRYEEYMEIQRELAKLQMKEEG